MNIDWTQFFDPALGLTTTKLLVAMLCGGAIGLERELSHKPAGLRTNILICIGTALLMITSRHISGGAPYTDPARLAAQAVSGIGFIGAGVIMQARGSVIGLTTAATIFLVMAVGITVGEGMFGVAILTTALIIFVLVLLRRLERWVVRKRRHYHYSFKTGEPAAAHARLLDMLEEERVRLEDFGVSDRGEGVYEVSLDVVTSVEGSKRLFERLPELGTDASVTTRAAHD